MSGEIGVPCGSPPSRNASSNALRSWRLAFWNLDDLAELGRTMENMDITKVQGCAAEEVVQVQLRKPLALVGLVPLDRIHRAAVLYVRKRRGVVKNVEVLLIHSLLPAKCVHQFGHGGIDVAETAGLLRNTEGFVELMPLLSPQLLSGLVILGELRDKRTDINAAGKVLARILKLVGSCIRIAGIDEFRAFIILERSSSSVIWWNIGGCLTVM